MAKNYKRSPSFPSLFEDGGLLVQNARPSFTEKVTVAFVLAMLSVFILFIDSNRYTAITAAKYYFFLLLAFSFLLLMAISIIAERLDKHKPHTAAKPRFFDVVSMPQFFICLYLLAAGISAAASSYGAEVWVGLSRHEGFMTLFLYTAVFLLISVYGRYSKYYMYVFAGAVAIFSVIAIIQYCGINFLGIYIEPEQSFYKIRFLSTLGNVDMVAALCSMAVPALFTAYILYENRWRFALLGAGCLALYTELLGNADSGKMGILAAVAILLPVLFVERRKIMRCLEVGAASCLVLMLDNSLRIKPGEPTTFAFKFSSQANFFLIAAVVLAALWAAYRFAGDRIKLSPKFYRIAIIAIILLAIVGGCIFVYSYEGGNQLLTDASELLHGNLSDRAGTERGYLWKRAVELIEQEPILGSGPDTFIKRFTEQYGEEYKIFTGAEKTCDSAHNEYLQIGVTIGLLGLIPYLAFVVTLAWRALKRVDRNPFIAIFAAAACGYLVHAFFSFSITIVTPVFWVFCGLTEYCIRHTPEPEKEDPAK